MVIDYNIPQRALTLHCAFSPLIRNNVIGAHKNCAIFRIFSIETTERTSVPRPALFSLDFAYHSRLINTHPNPIHASTIF